MEEDILRRLSFAMAEASHPLLMPGIFAELERSRHVQIVEVTIDELEKRIFELDFQSSEMEGMLDSDAETRNQEKRSAWLDTTYLRNALLSWSTQLSKISSHANELDDAVFKPTRLIKDDIGDMPTGRHPDIQSSGRSGESQLSPDGWVTLTRSEVNEVQPAFDRQFTPESDDGRESQKARRYESSTKQKDSEIMKGQLRRVGRKINDRIRGIIDEYDDKIRDCTMRVDGMAMATQWASSFWTI
jgi:hypothetical protein